ncbi:hypothetical protein BegalDRAFT_2686 [Beggiatoa alba B18LD]|uniref:Uncharacterized protein n=1 Tax=Beggiatoa alba B18LD TaxID=395493 RepID=I3CIT4_9GAMM|nr:hypothetical protein [Beggiatoa alba]EIJ43527.1 hypothetical protein BegalDRAFT_2686 [Beggiatoa alba B18LD]
MAIIRLFIVWTFLFIFYHIATRLSCEFIILFSLPVILIIALSMLESALVKRRAFVHTYLNPDSWLYRLLRGGLIMAMWQLLKALLFGLFLLVEMIFWESWVWWVLLLDIFFVYFLYQTLHLFLNRYLRPAYSAVISRHYLVIINTLIFSILLTTISLYMPYADYRNLSLSSSIQSELAQLTVSCDVFALFARLSVTKTTVSWWLAQHYLTQESQLIFPYIKESIWLLFLLSSTAFMWGYSRLLAGALLSPRAVIQLLESRG